MIEMIDVKHIMECPNCDYEHIIYGEDFNIDELLTHFVSCDKCHYEFCDECIGEHESEHEKEEEKENV